MHAQKDRWLRQTATQGGNSFLVVTGIELDGASAETLPPPLIHSATALFFGDSITGATNVSLAVPSTILVSRFAAEGTNAANYNFNSGTCGGQLGLNNNAATDSWAFAFAEAAAVEPSMAAFAAQVRFSFACGRLPCQSHTRVGFALHRGT